MKNKFIIISQDASGLGFALRLKEEGADAAMLYIPKKDEYNKKELMSCGKGLLPIFTLESFKAKKSKLKDAILIWDGNHNPELNKELRKEFIVFGSYQFTFEMEHDREKATKIAEKYGWKVPTTIPFNSPDEAIKTCEQNNDKIWIIKPDEGESACTFVPDSDIPEMANKEMMAYIKAQKPKSGIMQEKVKGVEANVEVLFKKGEPLLAHCNLEVKRKYEHSLGPNTGCSFDFEWIVPLDSQIVQQTIAKMYPFYKAIQYTGFGDGNFIFGEDGAYWLEYCNRFGYNASPNLLFNLFKSDLTSFFIKMTQGTNSLTMNDFRHGFGASVCLMVDPVKSDMPVIIPENIKKDIYWFDYKAGYLLSGYSSEVGILCNQDYTIEQAWQGLMDKAKKIIIPSLWYRQDGDCIKDPFSPILRYKALQALKLI